MKYLPAFSLLFFIGSCCNPNYICKTNKLPIFDYQGHRGCRGLYPENTIAAMKHAIDIGVTTLELDVVMSKDFVPILSHEPFFNHEISTKPNGEMVTEKEEKQLNIYQMLVPEIQKYDVGNRVHTRFAEQYKMAAYKPTLQQVFDSVQAYLKEKNKPQVSYNIETKTMAATDDIFHPKPTIFVDSLMAVIVRNNLEATVIIQSFDIRTLQYLHSKFPDQQTALLIEDYNKTTLSTQLRILGFIPTIYSPSHTLVTPLLLKQCKDVGMKLIPWTVNDLQRMKELKKMGVDGLISDFPNLYIPLSQNK